MFFLNSEFFKYFHFVDQSGKVRIWDTTQKEHILKNEFQPFVGTIKDLAWSPDNQRICVVGEGRERYMFSSVKYKLIILSNHCCFDIF